MVWLGIAYPVVIFGAQCLFRFSGWLGHQTIPRVAKNASDTLSSYTLGHSHAYFSDRFAGSILSKANNVVRGVSSILPEIIWKNYISLLSFLVTFAFMLTIDVWMAVIFLCLVLLLMILNRKLAPKKHQLSKQHAESRTKLTSRLADVISNVSCARQYTQIPSELDELCSLTEKRRVAHVKSWRYSEFTHFLNGLIMVVAMLAIFMILITNWQRGEVTTGDLVLVLALVAQISHTLLFIGQSFNSVAETFGEIEEGLEDILIDHEIVDSPNAQPLVAANADIVWNKVNFAYQSDTIFEGLSLNIKSGERIGLVGPSGAGKSTFVSLLLRQHDIQSGVIAIDGQDISEVTQDSLRQHIAFVPQEPLLFHRTIRENILYGDLSATDDDVITAAKRANAHDFISSLPNGYDTLVGERGVKLSGGQKQRVAIARAMLKPAPILILDEATSALDSESEVAIQGALEELMAGKTVIAVAHRLSTLRSMDRILVFEDGRIVEDGNHDKLSNADGLYARLWGHQAGGFLQDKRLE